MSLGGTLVLCPAFFFFQCTHRASMADGTAVELDRLSSLEVTVPGYGLVDPGTRGHLPECWRSTLSPPPHHPRRAGGARHA